MIGQTLGRYHIIEKIGEGGMGVVYRVHDERLDRDVALKVLSASTLADESALKRFRKEALALSKLNHPNIATVFDFDSQDGVYFLAMEYVAGETLAQKLTSGPLSEAQAVELGEQIAAALEEAHAHNIVHRDLKPGNIAITRSGRLKVLDFGLAKLLRPAGDRAITESLAEYGAAGTLPYMSPEQLRGETVDVRTDLYSAGAVLYEMAAGRPPFPQTHRTLLIDAILNHMPSPPHTHNHTVKPAFESIIMKALDKTPERRYQSAKELSVDLKRLVLSKVLTPLARRRVTRRAWLSIAGAISFAAIFALIFVGVRNFEISRHARSAPAIVSGIPPLSSGRFVAVLPIQVLGDASQVGYLAQGVQEALSTKLFQLKDLRVTSSDEADKADQKQPLTKIARTLGANYLVQGTLQGSGDRIRVTMGLQDALHDKRVWSGEFDGIASDLFTLEVQIYSQLVTALNINPTSEEIASARARPTENAAAYDLYVRGRNSLRSPYDDVKSIQSALDYFDQALHKDPAFVLTYIGTADASLRMYHLKKDSVWTQKALSAAQAAEQLDDGLPEVHSVLGSTYLTMGKYAEAVAELKRAVSLSPTSDEAYRRLGAAYLARGDYPHGIEAFQKAIDLNPYFWVNHNALGNAYFQSGDYSKASQSFKQITALAPDSETAYENIGNAFAQRGMYQESVPFFQKALQIEPYYTTYSNLGAAYFFLKQYAQAVPMFEKAVELNPNDSSAAVNLADAYRGAGQQDKARTTYQQAVSLGYKQLQTNPQDADVMAEIALCYANLGDAQQADTFIKKARAIDKSNVGYIYEEAQIYSLLGKPKEALKALQESLEKHYPAEAVAAEPNFRSLRNNPEFNELLKKYSSKKP
jgi:eukaryotic-like serine/threonine-protein kinase